MVQWSLCAMGKATEQSSWCAVRGRGFMAVCEALVQYIQNVIMQAVYMLGWE